MNLPKQVLVKRTNESIKTDWPADQNIAESFFAFKTVQATFSCYFFVDTYLGLRTDWESKNYWNIFSKSGCAFPHVMSFPADHVLIK